MPFKPAADHITQVVALFYHGVQRSCLILQELSIKLTKQRKKKDMSYLHKPFNFLSFSLQPPNINNNVFEERTRVK